MYQHHQGFTSSHQRTEHVDQVGLDLGQLPYTILLSVTVGQSELWDLLQNHLDILVDCMKPNCDCCMWVLLHLPWSLACTCRARDTDGPVALRFDCCWLFVAGLLGHSTLSYGGTIEEVLDVFSF